MTLPRIVVAAPSTGQGKTTIATGLMAALRAAGLEVSGHKVGPDYIDPGYHALATGRPGRNLDPHLVGEDLVAPLLLHGARGADVAVVEGVMGLHDGRIGGDGFASTAHVAALTRTPVVLVIDIGRLSRSAGAIVAGMAAYDPAVEVAGVILNQAGSDRNIAEVVRSMRGVPVLGVVRRDERLATPSRHLGLVPAAERAESERVIELLGDQVAAQVDLAAVLDVARSAPDLDAAAWSPDAVVDRVAGSPVVAMAGGRAFTFRYAETEELLRAAGCSVVSFDPLADTALPTGTSALYLGGGFPEVYAAELAANRSLLRELGEAVAAGMPTVAECAGMLYLAETLDGTPMAGILPTRAAMAERLTLRYPMAGAPADTLLTRAGEQVTGHEFHRTAATPAAGATPAWIVDEEPIGFAGATLHASYLHVHWAGHPQLASRFAAAASECQSGLGGPHQHQVPLSPGHTSPDWHPLPDPTPDPTPDPLRHHGDVEAREARHDFAVNVYAGPRPAWLETALSQSVAAVGSYPDPRPAREAIAARHRRRSAEVLPTSGAAEAFTLLARLRPWRRPVVVHPQFTEPHAALESAGRRVTTVLTTRENGFALDPAAIPADADLVVVGNPTNPTGVLHPAATIRALLRPGRLVVVDEAFMDAVPGEPETLTEKPHPGLLVLRSLTKHWSIPGIRAGYAVGDAAVVAALEAIQPPWSVSTPALAAIEAIMARRPESEARARQLAGWREELAAALAERDLEPVPGVAPYLLLQGPPGLHAALRAHDIAVRRADTFPGLDQRWIRVAVRPPHLSQPLLDALDRLSQGALA